MKKQNLTFLTGSSALQGIESNFLAENVNVKSYSKAKIDDLKDSLSKMDLSCYNNFVIHIGDNNIAGQISLTPFREKNKSLLSSLERRDLKVHVSCLLPRGGVNVKPFNEILQNIC